MRLKGYHLKLLLHTHNTVGGVKLEGVLVYTGGILKSAVFKNGQCLHMRDSGGKTKKIPKIT